MNPSDETGTPPDPMNHQVPADGLIWLASLDSLGQLGPSVRAVRVVDLSGCETKRDLILAVGASLEFPSYSAANWDSFEECLADLDWHSNGTLLVAFTHCCDSSLGDSDLLSLLAISRDVGQEWAGEGLRRLAVAFVGETTHSLETALETLGWSWTRLSE